MIKALLITPLPPQNTGLADYARRIIHLTQGHVEWTAAYPPGGEPIGECRCVPLCGTDPDEFPGPVVYQIGNSTHCSEIVQKLMAHPGKVLFHETNLHHLLRHMADESGEWHQYGEHVRKQYGVETDGILSAMGRKARSLYEYDMRLREHPLSGSLPSRATSIAVLSDTAALDLEKMCPGRRIRRMGFLADFLPRVRKPEDSRRECTIGIAGTFHYGRNWEAMAEAVVELRRTHPCRLVAAGAGWPETNHPWIEVTGRLSDEEYRTRLETFTIAMDLRRNTCGETSASLMDIMRSGKPAVITDEGSFRDIPAGAVLRIPSSSGATGAFQALRYLLDNPDEAVRVGRKAREYFSKISDRQTCLTQWLEFLKAGEE